MNSIINIINYKLNDRCFEDSIVPYNINNYKEIT